MFIFNTVKLIALVMACASIVAGQERFNAILKRDYPVSPIDPSSTSISPSFSPLPSPPYPTSSSDPPPPPPYPTGPPTPPICSTCSYPPRSTTATDDPWSTVYTTETITITSCASSITDCPARTTITTRILSSTLCSSSDSAIETNAGEVTSTTTLPPPWSTVYTTITYTISSCAPTITDCPYGSTTTDIISVTTTYCPVTPPVYPIDPPVDPAWTDTANGPFITPVTEPPELWVKTIINHHTKTRTAHGNSASGTGIWNSNTNETFVQSSAGLESSLSLAGTILLGALSFCFLF